MMTQEQKKTGISEKDVAAFDKKLDAAVSAIVKSSPTDKDA